MDGLNADIVDGLDLNRSDGDKNCLITHIWLEISSNRTIYLSFKFHSGSEKSRRLPFQYYPILTTLIQILMEQIKGPT